MKGVERISLIVVMVEGTSGDLFASKSDAAWHTTTKALAADRG